MSAEQRRKDRGTPPPKPVLDDQPLLPVWQPEDPIIGLAWGYVHHCPRGAAVSFIQDELAIDAVGEAVLAILERRDPAQAVRDFYAREGAWMRVAGRFLLED